ncbi:M20/M25/M40 family metallo-hydrolase [Maridesulfovibrio bastinii]|uniref:M20/M25/M40 family metallo-hydrolase n=1 Tax=Maridesulfovibrio bastinii TaxID=47157 RepID=UPI000402CFE1|nr:M20/M25/M40 family metallo-hydrolase [Maridesulfovibrio bastinii]
MVDTNRLVDTFISLVKIDSPSFYEKDVCNFLKKWAENYHFSFEEDRAADSCGGNSGNLIITVPATGGGVCPVFSAHMDCVKPCNGVEPVIKDGVIYSNGKTVLGGDDKGGIAAILEAVTSLESENIPHPEIKIVFTIVEESGMFGAKFLDSEKLNSNEIIVLDAEGSVGTLINRSPGKAYIDIEFIGRASHAGMSPEAGVSAIQLAAEAITRMQLLRIDSDTTANIGSISGGVATNIVADKVNVMAEARSISEEKLSAQLDNMKKACSEAIAKVGGSYNFNAELTYPPVDIPENDPLIESIVRCCEKCGIKSKISATGGGSDANVFSGKGMSVLTLGIGMTDVHTVNESIHIQSLVDAARITMEIMKSDV